MTLADNIMVPGGIAIVLVALALVAFLAILIVIWPIPPTLDKIQKRLSEPPSPMTDEQYSAWRQQQSAHNDVTESLLKQIVHAVNEFKAWMRRP